MHLDDKNVKIHIERIIQGPPSDGVWSVDAEAWIDDSGGKKHVKKVRVNVLKDDGYFDENGEGNIKLLERLKDCYKRILEEDPDYNDFVKQGLEKEKDKANEVEGGTFDV